MIFVWIALGGIIIALAYFIPGRGLELWQNVNMAGIVSVLYLIAVLIYTMRKPFSLKTCIITWTVFIVVGFSVITAWRTMEEMSHYQRGMLLKIRGVIGDGALLYYLREPSYKVLKAYHQQQPEENKSLKQVFQQFFPNDTVGSNIFRPPIPGDILEIYIASQTDSTIVLVGEVPHLYLRGKNPLYQNYDGSVGLLQSRVTLTAKGVSYESDN